MAVQEHPRLLMTASDDGAAGPMLRFLLVLLMLWLAPAGAVIAAGKQKPAAPAPEPEPSPFRAELVFEYGSNRVLHEAAAGEARFPASLTKLMTVYLAFQALSEGLVSEDDLITVSAHVAVQPRSRLGLKRGEKIRFDEALRATLVSSANDAAVALAEFLGESEENFARLMTGTALRLGMQNTRFVNASGLPNEAQRTTAHDMGLLARAVLSEYPGLFARYSVAEYPWRGQQKRSTNALMRDYPGTDGMKTGYTCGSGFNLIATAERDGRRLVGVVLGARSSRERNRRMQALLDQGFASPVAGLLSGISLDEVPTIPAGVPPSVIDSGTCPGGGCTRAPITSGELPGWAVLIGDFTGKSNAERALTRACGSTERSLRGQPALIERGTPEYTTWTALMVGYSQDEARKACKQIDKAGQVCRVLAPQGIRKTLGRPVAVQEQL
jgi:D-alanyl-D-alanine carboxypeptidase